MSCVRFRVDGRSFCILMLKSSGLPALVGTRKKYQFAAERRRQVNNKKFSRNSTAVIDDQGTNRLYLRKEDDVKRG